MAVNNSIVKKENASFEAYVGSPNIKNWLNGLLGNEKESQKFVSSVVSAVSTNPTLQECANDTIISSALLASALKLSLAPSLGLAYLVPFKDKKNNRTVATFVLGYKGYIQLAIRSGYYKKITVLDIKEGELKTFDPLNEIIDAVLIEDEEAREKAETVGYYAMFEHINGFKKALYWSKAKMLIHADKFSKAFSKESYNQLLAGKIPESEMWKYSSFWYKDFDGMAFKTMIRQLISKWGIMSIDMQTAYDNDTDGIQTSENFIDDIPQVQAEPLKEDTAPFDPAQL